MSPPLVNIVARPKPIGSTIGCTCPRIILPDAPPREPCPLHEGFSHEGTFYRRCGESDATGGPYYVGAPLSVEDIAS